MKADMISYKVYKTKEESMSAREVYHQVEYQLTRTIGGKVEESTFKRVCLLVTGIIGAKNASPAQVSRALERLKLSQANAESIERQVRRMENDQEITAALCFHPFARAHLRYGHPQELVLILDPTTQEDKIVMVSVAVWYRGRALPLAWATWKANSPLEGAGFWERIDELLAEVEPLLPANTSITLLADRAFGCAAFTDLLVKRGWHYVVRVQGQVLCCDRQGRQRSVASMVPYRGKRAKLRGKVFKKIGWRDASVVCYWGRRHKTPLCLVSDLPPHWHLIQLYRRRYPIEATFRDYKSFGWRWEQGQVKNLEHVNRLLVGMALATWFVLIVGSWKAQQILDIPPSGNRRTTPWAGKTSLFGHGLDTLHAWLALQSLPVFLWVLSDWLAPNWKHQLTCFHARAFIFSQ
jgi:hypothetical protein